MILSNAENDSGGWKTKFLIMFFILGAAFLILIALGLALLGISVSSESSSERSVSFLMLSAGTFAMVALLIPGIFLNIRKILKVNTPEFHFFPLRINHLFVMSGLIAIWILCLFVGQAISGNHIATLLLLPVINLLGISLPILFIIDISLRGLQMPEAVRGWSLFGATILVSPFLAFIFEGLLIGLAALLLIILANFNPQLRSIYEMFSNLLSPNPGDQDQSGLFAKLLFSPGVALSIFAIFSLAVPIIEETVKIIMIVPLLNKIDKPINGFVFGILCGAAFAFAENLGFASAGSAGWVFNALIRSTSGLPHIFNSGLLGWGLVSAWKDHRYWNLVKAFMAVILIHGTWNGISLGFSLNEISALTTNTPFLFRFTFTWIAGWAVLATGIFCGLILFNKKFRKIQITNSDENPGV